MTHPLSTETAALIAGLSVAIGECLFGVDGPLLFHRFGYNMAVSALIGVLVGAVVGYGAAVVLLRVLRREKVSGRSAHRMTADAHWRAHLRA
jgi:hypothetical protein